MKYFAFNYRKFYGKFINELDSIQQLCYAKIKYNSCNKNQLRFKFGSVRKSKPIKSFHTEAQIFLNMGMVNYSFKEVSFHKKRRKCTKRINELQVY